VDIDEMQRAILNLLLNAYEAVKGGGQVRITAYGDRPRQQVRLVIEDTGPGIPASYLEQQLFRPFQSTKAEGFGLGLYHAKTVIEAHRGSIEVRNREDRQGARVTVTLPGVDGGANVAVERTHRRG
jgi:signal transduction histidine kinase